MADVIDLIEKRIEKRVAQGISLLGLSKVEADSFARAAGAILVIMANARLSATTPLPPELKHLTDVEQAAVAAFVQVHVNSAIRDYSSYLMSEFATSLLLKTD